MLSALLDRVMERRAARLVDQVIEWLPHQGPVLDLGSGTGHLAARLQREHGLDVVTADVSDIHVVGPAPVLIGDGALPFDDRAFSAVLLVFMLAYPKDPAAVLAEAARVTRGPVIVVQTLHATRVGYSWFRVREFFWTVVAFYASKAVGYVPANAAFSMRSRHFFTQQTLAREITAAGLRVQSLETRRVLPDGSLVVSAWMLGALVAHESAALRRRAG